MTTHNEQHAAVARQVALAITQVCHRAGQAVDVEHPQDAATRAQNLLEPVGDYGPYICAGDPYRWGGPLCLVSINLEPKGCPGDCEPPLRAEGNAMDVAIEASKLMDGYYIQSINMAVAGVYGI